nr:MrfE protein [uncultured Moellerella sp.]
MYIFSITQKSSVILIILCWLLIKSIVLSHASGSSTTGVVTINATVIAQPDCVLSTGSDSLNVSFLDIREDLIDGVYYKKTPLPIKLLCRQIIKNELSMKVSWNNIYVSNVSAIKTNIDNLGISIYQDNTRLKNNDIINFNYSQTVNLFAIPIKPVGSTLSNGGDFTGALNLIINYQ